MEKNLVGKRIEKIRTEKKMSREELAENSGVSIEQIIEIEDDKSLPALAPLLKIARALGVRLGTFLDDLEDSGPVVCLNNEPNDCVSFSTNNSGAQKHMDYRSLSGAKANRHMEPFMINIAPCSEVDVVLSSHEGEEFILVMEGEIEISYGREIFQLKPGDSIYYDSIVPHHVHAYQNTAAKILAVVYVPM